MDKAIQKLQKSTQAVIVQQNHTIADLHYEMRTNHNSQAQSIGTVSYSVQNLAVNIEKGRFPSQPLPNPKGVHGVGTSQNNQQEEAKSIMTLRKEKLFDIKVEVPMRKTSDVSSSGQGTTQDSSSKDLEKSNPPAYIPKAPLLQRLAKPKQGTATNDIMEIFKQVKYQHPFT